MATRVKKVKITLRKSVIGRSPKHRTIVRSLGLRKLHQTVTHPDRPEVRGMIRKVSYLLEIEDDA
jgi:large subunit ribosomal protein L30